MASLYVHIPFCQRKCLFCSFVVSVGNEQRMTPYLEAVNLESALYGKETLQTLYVGGGTPSYLHHNGLSRLLSILKERFCFFEGMEFTLECNPESVDRQKADMLREAGINRISLGVQSFHDRYLQYLGRTHTAAQ